MKARHRVVMAGLALAVWVGTPTAAGAAHCRPGDYGCVHGEETVRPPDNNFGSNVTDPGGTRVGSAGSAGTAGTDGTDGTDGPGGTGGTGSSGLPVTGGDVLGLTVMGLGALGVGTVLVRRSRRPVPTS